jgi:hypothetical protein
MKIATKLIKKFYEYSRVPLKVNKLPPKHLDVLKRIWNDDLRWVNDYSDKEADQIYNDLIKWGLIDSGGNPTQNAKNFVR